MLDFSNFIFLQITTESFPISSSGHLELCLELIKKNNSALFTTLSLMLQRFDVLSALHLPTIFIIAIFYFSRFFRLMCSFRSNITVIIKSIGYVVAANCLTVICYVSIKHSRFSIPLWFGFLVTFVLLISSYFNSERYSVLDMKRFLFLGFVQGVAVLPGISRFAAVYAAAHWFGLSGRKAFDVAWMLQFPLILAAACVGWVQLVLRHDVGLLVSPSNVWALLLGTVAGFLGLYAMSFLAARNRLWIMALYIIIPLAISLWYGF